MAEAFDLGGNDPPEAPEDLDADVASIADAAGEARVGVSLGAGWLEEEARGTKDVERDGT